MASLNEIKHNWTVADVFEALTVLDYYFDAHQELMHIEEMKQKNRGRR